MMYIAVTPHYAQYLCYIILETVYFTGVLEPISLENVTGSTDLYIDGGVICNYPVYVFDGSYCHICM